ncbi:MAG: hypothetical protein RR448_08465 [Niameybacter sp.]|uniref:hypothetical protein n=1 Tax=Niameybacter sp. TaxID=2033640 RepID=UPI002FC9ABD3
MYCVVGEKVLQCEVKKKDERASVCKVGAAKKEQRVANNCIFASEEVARDFLKKKRKSQIEENNQVVSNVQRCNEMYEELFKETGIEVRTIDRQWTINMATKHIASLKKKIADKPELHAKNVSKAFHGAPSKKDSDLKRGRNSAYSKKPSQGGDRSKSHSTGRREHK